MGCSCFGDRSPPTIPPEHREEKVPKKTAAKSKPADESSPAPEPESIQFDLRVRSVDSIRTLQDPLNASYRPIRTLRNDKKSKLCLAEDTVTLQRCLIREVPKRGRKDLGRNKVKLPLEAQIWSKLDHPHILKLFEVTQDQENLYFLSEAFQGGELIELLEHQKSFFEERVAQVMHQIFSVLVYCHKQKIIHRNLQVQNFVLAKVPTVEKIHIKMIGFDDSCLSSNKKPLHSSTENSHYIAPEVRTNRFNEKCDMWSCGILMYHLLLGESPYGSCTSSELLLKVQRGAIAYSESLTKKLSLEGKDLIHSLLDLSPENRPSAADCLASPWILKFARRPSVSNKVMKESITNLAQIRSFRAIKRAVMAFIISRIIRPADLEELIDTFKILDENSDGQINREELQRGLQKIMSKSDALGQVDRIMKETDENTNGNIDYTEFLILAYNEDKLLSEKNLQMAFDSLDRDGSKKIDLSELKDLLFVKNEQEKEDLWRLVMRQMDRSGDGEIDYGEFRALMSKAYLL